MSTIPSIGAAGLGLLSRAETRLERSARAFTQSAASDPAPEGSAERASIEGFVDAAVGMIYARTEFRLGLSLIEVGRDTSERLIDLLA